MSVFFLLVLGYNDRDIYVRFLFLGCLRFREGCRLGIYNLGV